MAGLETSTQAQRARERFDRYLTQQRWRRYDTVMNAHQPPTSCSASWLSAVGLGCLVALLSTVGCDERSNTALTDPIETPARQPSPWRDGQGAPARIAVDPTPELEAALNDAIRATRETLDEARQRWMRAPESHRDRWAVKWAAPLNHDDNDPRVEYVWVQPVHWSAFRIEGILVNEPQSEIVARHDPPGLGDLVSFTADEAVDWVYYVDGRADGTREGGYTIDVLERFFGSPPP